MSRQKDEDYDDEKELKKSYKVVSSKVVHSIMIEER